MRSLSTLTWLTIIFLTDIFYAWYSYGMSSIVYNAIDMNQEVFNSVQKVRNTHNVTQEELAKAIGVTRQTIIAIEKGNYTPSILLVLKIARYFNTTVESLFTIDQPL